MAIEVVMPKQGNTVESCLVVEWKKSAGDTVVKGDVLCEVETDKTVLEVEAEAGQEGTVLAVLYEEGDDVPVMAPMMILGEPGEDISAWQKASGGSEEKAEEKAASAEETVNEEKSAAVTIEAASREPGSFVPASPRARKTAGGKAVMLEQVAGSGPGGRVLEADVIKFASAHPPVGAAARESGILAGMSGSGIGGRPRPGETGMTVSSSAVEIPAAEIEEIKVSGIRKVIATRMKDSLASTAQFTLNSSAPASSMMTWRKSFKNSSEALGLNGITLGDMVAFAVSRLLPLYPELNGQLKDGVIYRYSDVNMGIAVDTPRGLMVPVIKAANRKTLKQISDETKILAAGCMDGTIKPDQLSGGTFTISNLGAFGIESFTPVINAPEVAILGVCNIQQKPVLKNGETVFEPYMGFSMTIDHQAVDGAPAARFLKEFSRFLENFELVAAL